MDVISLFLDAVLSVLEAQLPSLSVLWDFVRDWFDL